MNRVPLFLKATVNKQDGKVSVVASTSVIDRQGESIDQAGWDLTNFLKNPVMLWAHNYDELPLGNWENIRVRDGELVMDAKFASAEANPKAENVRLLVDEGIQKTVSVGFIPLEREGHIITKAELLEVSFVPVPANPQALAFALSKGIDSKVMFKDEEQPPVEPVEPPAEPVIPPVEPPPAPEPVQEKSGRVLSEKNRNLISEAINQFKNSISVMEQLLEATNPPEKGAIVITLGEGSKVNDLGSQSKDGKVVLSVDILKGLLTHSRQADKANELVLRIIKSALVTKKD